MMKTELATSIGIAILGIVLAYFVCSLFIQPIEDKRITTVDTEVNSELTEPNVEVFNYKAINPTVEVYIGNCENYSSNGECLDDNTSNSSENQPAEEGQESF